MVKQILLVSILSSSLFSAGYFYGWTTNKKEEKKFI